MYQLIPKKDWLLVEPAAKSTGQILLPDSVKHNETNIASFRVTAVGPDAKKMGFGVGDEIITEGLNTPMFQYAGRDFWCARGENVVFTVKAKDGN